MKIIDAHAHIFPSKIEEKAVSTIGKFYDIDKMANSGTVEALVESGKKIGVVKYLVFSTATTKEQVESINRFISSECEKSSELIGLGTMHADYIDVEKEIDFLKENNIKGIKLHPDFQKFPINDERLNTLYECLSAEGMFILTHSGDYRYSFSNPDKVADVAKRFPKMNIIAAHFGGWSEWDKAMECLNLDNVYFDTSSTLGFKGREKAIEMLAKFDKSHFFFGTDFPMWNHEDELERFKTLGLSDTDMENILYNNFAKFYGIE